MRRKIALRIGNFDVTENLGHVGEVIFHTPNNPMSTKKSWTSRVRNCLSVSV